MLIQTSMSTNKDGKIYNNWNERAIKTFIVGNGTYKKCNWCNTVIISIFIDI